MMEEKTSPYVALEKAKKEGIYVNICEKTLYNYIHKEIFIELTANHCNIVKYMDTIFKYIFMERQNYCCLSM